MRLRIHTGAAFDLEGKEGTTALLARSLFPEDETRAYITEELGGRMEVTVDYDKIDILLSGRANAFETLAEILRNALVTDGTVDQKTLEALRTRLVADLEAGEFSGGTGSQPPTPAAQAADRTIAARLFGAYPLGRCVAGTPESLARLTRADLLLARERFIAPNNATLIVSGGIAPQRARLVLRQYLGAWRKSDALAQAAFQRPDAPRVDTLVVPASDVDKVELRAALRAPARTDRNHLTAALLASILRERLRQTTTPNTRALLPADFFRVRYDAYKPAGILTISLAAPANDAAAILAALRKTLQSLATTAPPTAAELEAARSRVAAAQTGTTNAVANVLLDTDTYGIAAIEDFDRRVRAVTLADTQRLAKTLFGAGSVVTVAAGDRERLEAELTKSGISIERAGANAGASLAAPRRTPGSPAPVPVSPLVPAANAPATAAPQPTAPPTKRP